MSNNNAMPGSGVPGDGIQPGQPSSGEGAESQGQPGMTQPGSTPPGYPQQGFGQPPSASDQGTSGQAAYGQGAPAQGSPYGQGTPGQPSYGQGAPGQASYGQGTPGQASYGQGTPGQPSYGQGAPGQVGYGQGTPGQVGYGQGSTQPGFAQPGFGQPGMPQPGGLQPGMPQPFLPKKQSGAWRILAVLSLVLSLAGAAVIWVVRSSYRFEVATANGLKIGDNTISWTIVILVLPVLAAILASIAASMRRSARGDNGWTSWLVVLAVVVGAVGVWQMSASAVRDESGAVAQAGQSSVMEMKVGDCFMVPDGDSVKDLTYVPCDQPHDAEVFSVNQSTATSYSAFDTGNEWEGTCGQQFSALNLGTASSDDVDYNAFTPEAEGWAQGDHEFVCFVYSYYKGDVLVGSLANQTLAVQTQP